MAYGHKQDFEACISAQNRTDYLLRDHLGSVDMVTDEAGAVRAGEDHPVAVRRVAAAAVEARLEHFAQLRLDRYAVRLQDLDG